MPFASQQSQDQYNYNQNQMNSGAQDAVNADKIADFNKITGANLPSNALSQPQGQVLGATTNNPQVNNAPVSSTIKKTTSNSGGSSKGNSTTNSLSAQQKALQKSLGQGFSNTIDSYKNQLNQLPGQQQEDSAQIDSLAGSQKNSINDALNSALQLLTNNRGQVDANQKQTLNDLADNTRNAFQAGNVYLGARGAGDSSAAGMYSAAMTQQANKQRSDILTQYDSQRNDINNTETQTRGAAQQQLDSVDTWQNTQMQQLTTQYQSLQRQLETAKANASDQEKQAINQLQTNLLTAAQNQQYNLQTVAAQYKSLLGSGLATGGNLANGAAINNTAAASNGQVKQLTAQQIASTPTMAQQSDGSVLDTATGLLYMPNQDGTYSSTQSSFLGNTNNGPINSLSQLNAGQ